MKQVSVYNLKEKRWEGRMSSKGSWRVYIKSDLKSGEKKMSSEISKIIIVCLRLFNAFFFKKYKNILPFIIEKSLKPWRLYVI